MGPGIIIPVVVIAVVVPIALVWAKRRLKDSATTGTDDELAAPASRLTSSALRDLPAPPWRVVYEIAAEKLGGIEHVLIGPAGVFAVRTSMAPLPQASTGPADAHAVAAAAIVRGSLDDALRGCAMKSDRLLEVHWGAGADDGPRWVEVLPGVTAVAGRSLTAWADDQPEELSSAQIDLAWQTVTTAIGRPDPLS
jgi:hypothetical protein